MVPHYSSYIMTRNEEEKKGLHSEVGLHSELKTYYGSLPDVIDCSSQDLSCRMRSERLGNKDKEIPPNDKDLSHRYRVASSVSRSRIHIETHSWLSALILRGVL